MFEGVLADGVLELVDQRVAPVYRDPDSVAIGLHGRRCYPAASPLNGADRAARVGLAPMGQHCATVVIPKGVKARRSGPAQAPVLDEETNQGCVEADPSCFESHRPDVYAHPRASGSMAVADGGRFWRSPAG